MRDRIQLIVSGPHRKCATEFGYGDYYTVCDETCEWDHIVVKHDAPTPKREIYNAVRRAKNKIRREHWESCTALEFPGFARVRYEIASKGA